MSEEAEGAGADATAAALAELDVGVESGALAGAVLTTAAEELGCAGAPVVRTDWVEFTESLNRSSLSDWDG